MKGGARRSLGSSCSCWWLSRLCCIVCGRGALFVGVGNCLGAGGIVCGHGASFVGVGSRLGAGGFVCGRGASFVDGEGVVAEVVWWLALSC